MGILLVHMLLSPEAIVSTRIKEWVL